MCLIIVLENEPTWNAIMGKGNFQYDETGNTYSYVVLTFLTMILVPATIYWWPSKSSSDKDKKKRSVQALAENTPYWQACNEKGQRIEKKDPWAGTRRNTGAFFLLVGWGLFALVVYQASQFDYEMANFDPYEILQVALQTTFHLQLSNNRTLQTSILLQFQQQPPNADDLIWIVYLHLIKWSIDQICFC